MGFSILLVANFIYHFFWHLAQIWGIKFAKILIKNATRFSYFQNIFLKCFSKFNIPIKILVKNDEVWIPYHINQKCLGFELQSIWFTLNSFQMHFLHESCCHKYPLPEKKLLISNWHLSLVNSLVILISYFFYLSWYSQISITF